MDDRRAVCLVEEVKYCSWGNAEGKGEDCVTESAESEEGDNEGQIRRG